MERNWEDPAEPRGPGLNLLATHLNLSGKAGVVSTAQVCSVLILLPCHLHQPPRASSGTGACDTTVLFWSQKIIYYQPEIAFHQSLLGAGNERQEEEGWEQKLGACGKELF